MIPARKLFCACVAMLLGLFSSNLLTADVVSGSKLMYDDGNELLHLELNLDSGTGIADIIMQGIDNGWFSVGFGAQQMNGTYAIIVEQDGSVMERKLGNHNAGQLLAPTVSVVSNVTANGIRTIHLQRALDVGDSNYYEFQAVPGDIDLIGAWYDGAFGYHGNTNFVVSNISMQVPEPTMPACLMIGVAVILLAFRRTRVASKQSICTRRLCAL